MVELMRTNDPVLITWLEAYLADAGVEAIVFDTHASIIEGSINAIQRRVMVSRDDAPRARRLLAAAGIDHNPA